MKSKLTKVIRMHGCRTCLSRYDLRPLFSENGVVRFSSDQLLSVTGVKIAPNDGLPQSACRTCIKQISKTLELQELSSKVDQKLRSMMHKYDAVIKNKHNDNKIQNLIDPFSDENLLFCKDIKQKFIKEFGPCAQGDHNNDHNISLDKNTGRVTLPQSYENDINKISTNDVDIPDSHDYDSNDNNDTNNTDPIIEIIDKSIDINGKCNRDKITENGGTFKQSIDTNDCKSNGVLEPEVFATTSKSNLKKDITIISSTNNKEHEYLMSKLKLLSQMKSTLSKSDLAKGRLCDVRIENFISKKELKELFEDDITEHVIMKSNFADFYNTNKSNRVMSDNYHRLMSLIVKPYLPMGPFQCKLCYKKLVSLNGFRNHAKLHFEPEFPCQQCEKKFYSRNFLLYHQQRMHGKEKPLSCSLCDYKAVDGSSLTVHKYWHTGERPFICNECGAAFRSRSVIVQHMSSHFGVKNIQCEMCSAMFTRRSKLWGHQMKTHWMKYTYFCYLCSRTYRSICSVKKHLLKFHGVPRKEQHRIKFIKTKRVDSEHSASANSSIPTTK